MVTTLGLMLVLSEIDASSASDAVSGPSRVPPREGRGRHSPAAHREAHATAWMPGDDVPGWEDYDCGEPATGPTVTIELPITLLASPSFGSGDEGEGGAGFYSLVLSVGDCMDGHESDCDLGSSAGSSTYTYADLTESPRSVETRGLGWYTYYDHSEPDHFMVAHGQFPFGGPWTIDNLYNYMEGRVCIARLRPDEVSGVMDFVVYNAESRPGGTNYYDSINVRIPFDYIFSAHDALYLDGGFDCTKDLPPNNWVGYSGFLYEDAWPWDEITDPTIRDLLYEEYTPCNSPP